MAGRAGGGGGSQEEEYDRDDDIAAERGALVRLALGEVVQQPREAKAHEDVEDVRAWAVSTRMMMVVAAAAAAAVISNE